MPDSCQRRNQPLTPLTNTESCESPRQPSESLIFWRELLVLKVLLLIILYHFYHDLFWSCLILLLPCWNNSERLYRSSSSVRPLMMMKTFSGVYCGGGGGTSSSNATATATTTTRPFANIICDTTSAVNDDSARPNHDHEMEEEEDEDIQLESYRPVGCRPSTLRSLSAPRLSLAHDDEAASATPSPSSPTTMTSKYDLNQPRTSPYHPHDSQMELTSPNHHSTPIQPHHRPSSTPLLPASSIITPPSTNHRRASTFFFYNTTNSHDPAFNRQSTLNLQEILNVFQRNISLSQAWAILYQSANSLRDFLEQYDDSLLEADFDHSSLSESPLPPLEIPEICIPSHLYLDFSGAVSAKTFGKDVAQPLSTSAIAKTIPIKSVTSINSVVERLAAIAYQAVTFKWNATGLAKKSQRQRQRRKSLHGSRLVFETDLDEHEEDDGEESEDDAEDDEEDYEADIEREDKQLHDLMMSIFAKAADDQDGDRHSTGSSSLAGDDEGCCIEDEEYTSIPPGGLRSLASKSKLAYVLAKCNQRYEQMMSKLEVASSNHESLKDFCPLLVMLHEKQQQQQLNYRQTIPLNANIYYRNVCVHLIEEYQNLKTLLHQLNDLQRHKKLGGVDSDSGISSSSSSKSGYSSISTRYEEPDLENLKKWASTWMSVMSQMRFGVRLNQTNPDEPHPNQGPVPKPKATPFTRLLSDIRSVPKLRCSFDTSSDEKRFTIRERQYQHSKSLPHIDYRLAINQTLVQDQLKSLKPSGRRSLKPRPTEEPCLHDRLMMEIRGFESDARLSHVIPVVKCLDFKELYHREREIHFRHREGGSQRVRPQSATFLGAQYQHEPAAHLISAKSSTALSWSASNSQQPKQVAADIFAHEDMFESTSSLGLKSSQATQPIAAIRSTLSQEEPVLRRFFRSMRLKSGKSGSPKAQQDPNKRKNLAADDSFNTSLPHNTPVKIASKPQEMITPQRQTPQTSSTRKYQKNKKLKPPADLMSSPLSNQILPQSLLAPASSSPHVWQHQSHAPYRQILDSARSVTSLNSSTPLKSLRNQQCTRQLSLASSVSILSSQCNCPKDGQTAPLVTMRDISSAFGSSSSIHSTGSSTSSLHSPSTPSNRSFVHQNFDQMRRSFVLPRTRASPPNFQYASMRRSQNDLLLQDGSAKLQRAQSPTFVNAPSKSSSKWNITALFSKLVSNIGNSNPAIHKQSPSVSSSALSPKVKRE